jgi:hypothetical protein
MWALAQSTFVDEHDRPAFFPGFLISGQRFRFHCRIFSSFRSSARPTGRWQLQPNCRRMRARLARHGSELRIPLRSHYIIQ